MVAPAQTSNPITLENCAGVLCAATKSAFNPFQKAQVTSATFPSPAWSRQHSCFITRAVAVHKSSWHLGHV